MQDGARSLTAVLISYLILLSARPITVSEKGIKSTHSVLDSPPYSHIFVARLFLPQPVFSSQEERGRILPFKRARFLALTLLLTDKREVEGALTKSLEQSNFPTLSQYKLDSPNGASVTDAVISLVEKVTRTLTRNLHVNCVPFI